MGFIYCHGQEEIQVLHPRVIFSIVFQSSMRLVKNPPQLPPLFLPPTTDRTNKKQVWTKISTTVHTEEEDQAEGQIFLLKMILNPSNHQVISSTTNKISFSILQEEAKAIRMTLTKGDKPKTWQLVSE